jgi:ketosteroid isomerase-like protein
MHLELTEQGLQTALTYYEGLFERGDVEAILDDFTDDAEVRYGTAAPFVGKDKLGDMLRRRFAGMRDYRLTKRLELLSPPGYAASWTGRWIDVGTGRHMEIFGLELLTVRDGKICKWWASVSTRQVDE